MTMVLDIQAVKNLKKLAAIQMHLLRDFIFG